MGGSAQLNHLKAKAQPVENFAGAGELFAMEVRVSIGGFTVVLRCFFFLGKYGGK